MVHKAEDIRLFQFAALGFLLVCSAPLLAQSANADEYVTGMIAVGKPGGGASCPPIVWFVEPDTPAAETAIQPGDRVLAVDGHRGIDAAEARPLLHTKDAKPSTIELEGQHGRYTVTVGRIKESALLEKEGWKVGPDGNAYALDASEAEMKRVAAIVEPPRERSRFQSPLPNGRRTLLPGVRGVSLAEW